MRITIVDGYTDEPSGLGVPPYLGTYPRYLAGWYQEQYPEAEIVYLTVDDVRAFSKGLNREEALKTKYEIKSNISLYSITEHHVGEVLEQTDILVCVVGVQVPGKYLSARPAMLSEMLRLTKDVKCKKVLAGPAVSKYGTQVEGGKKAETLDDFDVSGYELIQEDSVFTDYGKLASISLAGAAIAEQFPQPCIAEIEISQGCWRTKNCSFCTEPLRMDREAYRKQEDIIAEMKALYDKGVRRFRLGRSTCVYSYMRYKPDELEKLFVGVWDACPDIDVLHIDNVRPELVCTQKGRRITELIVKYCTPGNIAAFGCESFDEEVCRKNNLNAFPDKSLEAVRVLNELGGERGKNGMPKFLAGINLIFGLMGESKKTHELNMQYLKQMIDEDLMVRRINVRQVVPFPGTDLFAQVKNKFLKKNGKYYFSWRNQIRQEVDVPMLRKVFPEGLVLHDVFLEIYDGNTTFARQFGTYPVVIGIKGRHELRTFVSVKIIGYMKRSLIGEIVNT